MDDIWGYLGVCMHLIPRIASPFLYGHITFGDPRLIFTSKNITFQKYMGGSNIIDSLNRNALNTQYLIVGIAVYTCFAMLTAT